MAGAALDDLDRRLKSFGGTRVKLEKLYAGKQLARRDLERVYEGLYVASVTSFEDFLEARFFEVMMKAAERKADVIPRADFKSQAVLREFVLGGRRFVNWLPYGRTEERAAVYLRGGRPFDVASGTEKRQMKDWMTIRNAIAHTSREARRKFDADILSGLQLLPQERTPAGFLRSTLTIGTTRYENITNQMLTIGAKFC